MVDVNNIVSNTPNKGLVTNLHNSLVPSDIWTYARNAKTNSHLGQVQFLQNEPSNVLCVDLPYTPIGFIKLLNNKWAVFTTDNHNSEIGIFDENACTYKKVVNNKCLNFSTSDLIQGEAKENFDCTETIYWTDVVNPRRYLNLSNVPYKFTYADDTCQTKVYTNELDCTELQVDTKINVPNITPRLGVSGVLKNGSYQVAIAYAVNNVPITEYYTASKIARVWSHENRGQSIDITISNLDKSYNQFELAVIYTIDEVTSYKSLGFYNINTTYVNINSIEKSSYTTLDQKDIFIKRPRYPYADLVTANDQYLLWAGVKQRVELNYQKTAMDIISKYVVYEVPADYYVNGGIEVGYERDEVYAFGIQWLYVTGEWSPAYHIPGRQPRSTDTQLASGPDMYEKTIRKNDSSIPDKTKRWQVENTASNPRRLGRPSTFNERVIGEGDMGYWESEITYANNVDLYGVNACLPVRHHLFPDNLASHIHSTNGTRLNILGVKFDNIKHPKDVNGKYIQDIVGYRIVRSDRKNDRSIIAKGLMTNVRSYKENDGTEVMYPNYPYNDLRQDNFISSRQTYMRSGGERNMTPLTSYKTDQFNFYGPHSLFSNVSLGTEVKILREESANVKGQFQEPRNHPKQKLLTQFDMYFALIIGAIDGFMALKGNKVITNFTNGTAVVSVVNSTPPSASLTTFSVLGIQQEQYATDAISRLNGLMKSKNLGDTIDKILARILLTLAKVGLFAYFALNAAQNVLTIISEFSPWQQYALQYNSVGNFNTHRKVQKDNRRRYLSYYQYIRDGLNTVESKKFNNYKRESSVYLRLNESILEAETQDNSRGTLADFGKCGDKRFDMIDSTASAFYASIKKRTPQQYGNLDSVRYLDTGTLVTQLQTSTLIGNPDLIYTTDTVFGGDTFINRMAVKRSHHYFSQFLHDVPDGIVYDYRIFRNIGYPRYWIDSSKFDMSEFVALRPTTSNTPLNKHNLDCGNDPSGLSVVKNKYFYLFNSGVMNFYVESDYNLDLRDWKEQEPTFYSRFNSDANYLFRSDKIELPERFVYDKSFSKEITENSIVPQQSTYNPINAVECQAYHKNKVIYSQSASLEQRSDHWLTYLALNYYDFSQSDFGNLTLMKPIDNQQVMFLFDKSSPYITVGRDELKLDGSGNTITLGDGGLFAREPRPITYTDYHFGNSQSKWAFNCTQFGIFYPSQRQGNVFRFTGKLDDITMAGMNHWFNNNLPSTLLKQFPNFKRKDNPLTGVGLTSVFDPSDKIYYLSKRDYKLKDGLEDTIGYEEDKDRFVKGHIKIELTDKKYFDDLSWTISFDPKSNLFVSWHDWHPDWALQSEHRFMTTKNKGIWKHNEGYNNYCNFYGVDYPFEIEYVANNGPNTEILRSIEYQMDFGKYFNGGNDFYQILDGNFDQMVVHNNEQISGNLAMKISNKKDVSERFNYPKFDPVNGKIDIIFDKEEQKYRVNQFFDIVKDRGEFTHKAIPLWNTHPNGYIKAVNEKALDYNKAPQARRKFRSVFHKILLRKLISGENKIIFKFASAKEANSFR